MAINEYFASGYLIFISPRYKVIAFCKLPQPHTRNTLSTSPTTQQTQPRRASSHVIPLVLSSTQHASPGGGLELVVNRSRVLSRSEEHTSELQSLMRISYADFRLKK